MEKHKSKITDLREFLNDCYEVIDLACCVSDAAKEALITALMMCSINGFIADSYDFTEVNLIMQRIEKLRNGDYTAND